MENSDATAILLAKWKNRVPKGWYGFSCIPQHWYQPINNFLIRTEKLCPNFEIHQIKEKFGSCRIYIETNTRNAWENEQIQAEIDALEETLR